MAGAVGLSGAEGPAGVGLEVVVVAAHAVEVVEDGSEGGGPVLGVVDLEAGGAVAAGDAAADVDPVQRGALQGGGLAAEVDHGADVDPVGHDRRFERVTLDPLAHDRDRDGADAGDLAELAVEGVAALEGGVVDADDDLDVTWAERCVAPRLVVGWPLAAGVEHEGEQGVGQVGLVGLASAFGVGVAEDLLRAGLEVGHEAGVVGEGEVPAAVAAVVVLHGDPPLLVRPGVALLDRLGGGGEADVAGLVLQPRHRFHRGPVEELVLLARIRLRGGGDRVGLAPGELARLERVGGGVEPGHGLGGLQDGDGLADAGAVERRQVRRHGRKPEALPQVRARDPIGGQGLARGAEVLELDEQRHHRRRVPGVHHRRIEPLQQRLRRVHGGAQVHQQTARLDVSRCPRPASADPVSPHLRALERLEDTTHEQGTGGIERGRPTTYPVELTRATETGKTSISSIRNQSCRTRRWARRSAGHPHER